MHGSYPFEAIDALKAPPSGAAVDGMPAGLIVNTPASVSLEPALMRTAVRPFRTASVYWIAVHERRNFSPQVEGHT